MQIGNYQMCNRCVSLGGSLGDLETIFDKVIDIIEKNVGTCNKDRVFMARYLAGAVLSYIESYEQQLVLSMKFDEWVPINSYTKNEIMNKIIEYANKFAVACRDKPLSDVVIDTIKDIIRQELIVEKTICYLYKYGIYDDEVSRFIIIKDVPPNDCTEILSEKDVEVRSRFIEIAKNLYLVKQRFPNKSSFEANPLVDRVFAYVEPRNLPLGKTSPPTAFDNMKNLVQNIYKAYNEEKLNRTPNEEELEVLEKVLSGFFNEIYQLSKTRSELLFYEYQVRGIERLLNSILTALKEGKTTINIIEAPTGAGKTEIFVLTLLILAFIRRLALYYLKKECKESEEEYHTPIAIIVYPRLALASNQIDRLLRYIHVLNSIIKSYGEFKGKEPLVTLSMNYTEVRFKNEYMEAARKFAKSSRGNKLERVPLSYGVQVDLERGPNNQIYIGLKYFKCPDGSEPKLVYDQQRGVLISDVVYCGNEKIDYIRVTKEDVRDRPGDIHITLFETLRQNLWSRSWSKLFGIKNFDGPLVFVLDEIHTYTGITGARYAYVLRRTMARIRHQVGDKKKGFVIVGLSATIPNPEEFIQNLLMERISRPDEVFIRVDSKETIPMGNEYFFIIIPTMKYLVNFASVSIQSVMTLFYNLPPFSDNGRDYVKKAFVFIDNLDVVARMRHDLQDAVKKNKTEGSCTQTPYGLQDLRNPYNPCFDATRKDYGDYSVVLNLEKIYKFNSWKDGELWWPYALEYSKVWQKKPFNKVAEYTSKKREKIEESSIVVTTSALEVGVDYRDVVLIYQHGAPPNISSLIQRAGRAGRRIYRNPLTRTAVAVLLSPDIPTQTFYFEIFTRAKSLRDALSYDRLYIPTNNEYVVKQTLLEAVIDYLIYKFNKFPTMVNVDNILVFECKQLPEYIDTAMKNNTKEFEKYLAQVFPYHKDRIISYLKQIKNDIVRECKRIRSSGG